jgi:hypothetical protein
MQILIDGTPVIDRPFEDLSELYTEYGTRETELGRELPSYDPLSMALALALFLTNQGINAALRRRDRARGQQRHEAILQKLEAIEHQANVDTRRRELLALAEDLGLDIQVRLQTKTEADLKPGFERLLPGKILDDSGAA